MKRRKISRIITGTLAVGLLLSQGQPYNVLAQSPLELKIDMTNPSPEQGAAFAKLQTLNGIKINNAEQMMNLTPEQREAITTAQTLDKSGIQLSPDVDLDSTDEISVIVEFKQKPSKVAVLEATLNGEVLTEAEGKVKVKASHDNFKKDLATVFSSKGTKKGPSYQVNRSYTNAFNGVAMKLPANEVKNLLQSNTVKAIYSDVTVQVEPAVKDLAPTTYTSPTGLGMAAEREYLQVDKLHEEGYTGKGIKVGVIDTGIDYNHPDLKDAYKGGWDFVGNDAYPMEATYDDWVNAGKPGGNPAAYLSYHGTHVSGTIVGRGTNNSPKATTGIAPDAELYGYRVLAPGGGTTANVIAGIDKAVEDGMDIINMSLGAAVNMPMYATSIAANNAVLSGVTTLIAAGNSGDGMYTLGSPGAAALPITVGASDVPAPFKAFNGSLTAGQDKVSADLRLLALGVNEDISKLKGQTNELVYIGMGAASDFTGKNVNGKIALISRGNSITLVDKIKAAKKNGAVGVLLFNNVADEGHIPANLGESTDHIPTFSLSNADGLALKQKVDAGYTSFTFGDMYEGKTKGDSLAGFSSRGPSHNNYDIKPEVVAPGVNMLSTFPAGYTTPNDPTNYSNAYASISGTSMATPFTAGVAALLLQANPDLTPSDVKATLMNTADELIKPYSVFEIGAGRVDPYEAIHSGAEIIVKDTTPTIVNGLNTTIKEETAALSFGHISATGQNATTSRRVVLKNKEKATKKTFDVTVKYQANLRLSKDPIKNGVKVITDSSIRLNGMSEKSTTVTLSIPKNAEQGFYEGYVVYTNHDNPSETYQVPFGVNYEEDGFNSVQLLTGRAVSTVSQTDLNPMLNNAIFMSYNVKSRVDRIDWLIYDAKTDKLIGNAGINPGYSITPNRDNVTISFFGLYTPFIGDQSKPFSTDPKFLNSSFSDNVEFLKPGSYKMKAVGTDSLGRTFTAPKDELFFVNNSRPKFNVDFPGADSNGIMEYDPTTITGIPFSGSIYDDSINVMKDAGFSTLTQAANTVRFYGNRAKPNPNTTGLYGQIPTNPDGTFSGKLGLNVTKTINSARLFGINPSGVGNFGQLPTFFFVQKGKPYVTAIPNKKTLNTGNYTVDATNTAPSDNKVTYTLTMHNATNLNKQTFNFEYLKKYFDIESIKVNPDLANKGTVTMTDSDAAGSTAVNYETTKKTITVALAPGQSVNGDVKAVDVTLRVKNGVYYDYELDLKNIESSVTNTVGVTSPVEGLSIESYVNPTSSKLTVSTLAEAIPTTTDYAKAGIITTITDK